MDENLRQAIQRLPNYTEILVAPEVKYKELLTNRRKDICKECEYKRGAICEKCFCAIPLKVHVTSTFCPIEKW